MQEALARIGLYQPLRPLAIGIVHGLASSAAVALLVLTTIQDPRWASVYLLVFGVGTIAGMMPITMIIGAPFPYTGKGFGSLNRGFPVDSGPISFGLRTLCHFPDRVCGWPVHRPPALDVALSHFWGTVLNG